MSGDPKEGISSIAYFMRIPNATETHDNINLSQLMK